MSREYVGRIERMSKQVRKETLKFYKLGGFPHLYVGVKLRFEKNRHIQGDEMKF
jgi:hypothetical protein